MRIQNNVMAMNTHRMYTINNSNIQKSAEKLSSGYRINRAGDDAAGLAISEKMRSQIRGLGMASKNSQDAISLVQTAEGALQEVHTMLQRMNELSVQSATGTNQELDRNQLAKEFNQLRREINDIAEQTTFNNMKILDGSLSNEGPQRSAQTAGIYATTTDDPAPVAFLAEGFKTGKTEIGASFTIDLSMMLTGVATSADGACVTATFGASSTNLSVTVTPGTQATDLPSSIIAGLNKAFGATLTKSVQINNVLYEVTWNGTDTRLEFTATEYVDYSSAFPANNDFSIATSAGISGLITASIDLTSGAITSSISSGITGHQALATYTFDRSKMQAGDTLTIRIGADEVVKLTLTEDDLANDTKLLDAITNVASSNFNCVGDPTNSKITFTATDKFTYSGDWTVTVDRPGLEGTVPPDGAKPKLGTTYIEFDATKMREGDIVNLGDGSIAMWKEGDTLKTFAAKLNIGEEGKGYDIDGNTLKLYKVVMQDEIDESFLAGKADPDSYGTMRIQVGALENEQLNIEVKTMNSFGLALDKADLSNQDDAGKAITSTRDAINLVSDQRSLLGAMQNRLEHKISNLDNTAENLQSAESRIRDVDVAKEMTNYTKNNILAQASTAMLAQANAAPQSVLSLLQ